MRTVVQEAELRREGVRRLAHVERAPPTREAAVTDGTGEAPLLRLSRRARAGTCSVIVAAVVEMTVTRDTDTCEDGRTDGSSERRHAAARHCQQYATWLSVAAAHAHCTVQWQCVRLHRLMAGKERLQYTTAPSR